MKNQIVGRWENKDIKMKAILKAQNMFHLKIEADIEFSRLMILVIIKFKIMISTL